MQASIKTSSYHVDSGRLNYLCHLIVIMCFVICRKEYSFKENPPVAEEYRSWSSLPLNSRPSIKLHAQVKSTIYHGLDESFFLLTGNKKSFDNKIFRNFQNIKILFKKRPKATVKKWLFGIQFHKNFNHYKTLWLFSSIKPATDLKTLTRGTLHCHLLACSGSFCGMYSSVGHLKDNKNPQ